MEYTKAQRDSVLKRAEKYFLVVRGVRHVELFVPWNKMRSVRLDKTPEGGFRVYPPKYPFTTTQSIYTYAEGEERMCRNKNQLMSIIDKLKKCGLWDMIENKDFYIPNPNYKGKREKVRR